MEFEITYDLRANAWRRLANYFIDLAAQYILAILFGLIAGLMTYFDIYGPINFIRSMSKIEEYLIGCVLTLIYYFIFEALTGGRTPGKYLTNTKVLTWYGEKPSTAMIAKRTLCRLIPFDHFSFLAENPRGWHDSISETVVVDLKKYQQALEYKLAFDEIGTPEKDLM